MCKERLCGIQFVENLGNSPKVTDICPWVNSGRRCGETGWLLRSCSEIVPRHCDSSRHRAACTYVTTARSVAGHFSSRRLAFPSERPFGDLNAMGTASRPTTDGRSQLRRRRLSFDCAVGDPDFLEVCLCGFSGIRRCRTFTRSHAPRVVKEGFGLCKVVMAFPPHADAPPPGCKYTATGEFCVKPDMTTVAPLPWRKNASVVLGDLYTEAGEAAEDCPRNILRKAVVMLKEEFGYDMKMEFLLLDKSKVQDGMPVPRVCQNYAAQNDMVVHSEVLEEMIKALEEMNIDAIHFHPEAAYGQYEIAIAHADPVKACDQVLLARLAVVAVAHRHGFDVTFLPKVIPDMAGNGAHVHMSLQKNGEDVSRGPTPRALSHETQYFLNGMLKHQPAWVIWSGSTCNSFQRYRPHCWATELNVWGVNNRAAMLRVVFPSKWQDNHIHFEQRCFDQTANPHIGVAALIAAGILGLREKKLLPSRTQVDPSDLSAAELEKKEAKPGPRTMYEAIAAFHGDDAFKALFTQTTCEDFIEAALASRKATADYFAPKGTDAEIKALYNLF